METRRLRHYAIVLAASACFRARALMPLLRATTSTVASKAGDADTAEPK